MAKNDPQMALEVTHVLRQLRERNCEAYAYAYRALLEAMERSKQPGFSWQTRWKKNCRYFELPG